MKQKIIFGKVKSIETDGVIIGIASTENKDREGDIIKIDGWETENFMKSGRLFWAHKSNDFPIGTIKRIWTEGKRLMFEAKLYLKDELASKVYQFMKDGILDMFSVGFIPKEMDGDTITRQELLEISVVPIAANSEAMTVAIKSGVKLDLDSVRKEEDDDIATEKGVIGFAVHGDVPTASEDAEWDAGGEVRKADVKKLKKMCTWFDSANSDLKSSYKLPHHRADGQVTVVWRAVAAAMAALFGARGGVDVPSGDRKGIYNHLVKHYKQFDKEAPEFRYVEAEVLKNGTDDEIKDFLIEHPEFIKIYKNSIEKALSIVTELTGDDTHGSEVKTHASDDERPNRSLILDLKAIDRIANRALRGSKKSLKRKFGINESQKKNYRKAT